MTQPISNQGIQELLYLLRMIEEHSISEEELAELGELEIDDEEEAYRELALIIADGKPLRGSTTTLYDEYKDDDYA